MAGTASNFVKIIVALIKGDDAEVTALKIQKKAVAALKAQIAVKEATTLELEDNVDLARTELDTARVNKGAEITNNKDYIKSLLETRADLLAKEEILADHLAIVSFLREELQKVQG